MNNVFSMKNIVAEAKTDNNPKIVQVDIQGETYLIEVKVNDVSLKLSGFQNEQLIGKAISLCRKASIGVNTLFDKGLKATFTITKGELEESKFYLSIDDVKLVNFINENGLTNEKL